MYDAVICEPVRTPVGGFGGIYRDIPVTTLASTVLKGLIERTSLTSEDIDDVIFGQATPTARRRPSAGSLRSTPVSTSPSPAFSSTAGAAPGSRP